MKKNNMKREALGPCGFNMQRYSHKLQDIQSDSTTPRWGVKKHSGAGERVVIPRSWGLKSLPGLDIVMPSQANNSVPLFKRKNLTFLDNQQTNQRK